MSKINELNQLVSNAGRGFDSHRLHQILVTKSSSWTILGALKYRPRLVPEGKARHKNRAFVDVLGFATLPNYEIAHIHNISPFAEWCLRFSVWSKFDLRDEIENTKYPGIYAIAISTKNIAGTPFHYRKEIVYFGMTNSKSGLCGRLNAFNNTLRDKSGPGHGGAERFRYDYESGDTLAKRLYVAVCPFKCNVSSIARKDLETMGEVVRAEYLALANYAELFGRLPKYNDKKNSPKLKG